LAVISGKDGGHFLYMDQVEVYAPATVANVVCGFDVLGFALEGPGDKMVLRKSDAPGVRIVHRDGFAISCDAEMNVAGVTLLAILSEVQPRFGFELEITKSIMPGSGIGSSAASAAGAAVAANKLLGDILSDNEVIEFAMTGEAFASGSRHADNIAPAVLGGFTLVRSIDPLEVVRLEFPPLWVTIVHPQIEVLTVDARAILPNAIPLESMIRQTANIGALVAGLSSGNYDLISRSLEDQVIQPVRSRLIPSFEDIRSAALLSGAIGSGIAGSGPSTFAFSKDVVTARKVCVAMSGVYEERGIKFETYISKISPTGARVI
jgi:homoserine kinase